MCIFVTTIFFSVWRHWPSHWNGSGSNDILVSRAVKFLIASERQMPRIFLVFSFKAGTPATVPLRWHGGVCGVFWWLVTAQLLMHIHAKLQPGKRTIGIAAAFASLPANQRGQSRVLPQTMSMSMSGSVPWSTSWPPLSVAVLALRQLLPSVFSCRCRNAWICKRPLRVATPTQLTHLMRQKDGVWLVASAGPSQKAINGPKLSLSRCKCSPNTWECLWGCRRGRKVHN